MADGKVTIVVDVDTGKGMGEVEQVKKGLLGLGSVGEKAGGMLGSLKDKLSFGAVAGAAASAVTALTGGIGDLISEAVSANDAIDKFKSTMQFAGFGKKEIASATKDMRKYADDTVYDLNTVLNTAAQLGANGVKNFTGLTKSAGNLNAVAGGNADTFKSVAMVLTQTAGAGKLTTENWNQLADAIPGASGMLQKAMKKNGAYTGNFRDAMADGQITADEFNKAITELGNNPAAIKAATSTKTFEGAIGNLQAAAVGGIQKIIDGFNKLSQALTGSTLPELIGQIGNGLGGAFDNVGSSIGNLAPLIKAALAPFAPLIWNIQNQFATLSKSFNLKGLATSLQPAMGVLKTLNDAVARVANGAFVALLMVFYNVGDAFQKVFGGNQMAGVFNDISSIIRSFVTIAQVAFGQISQTLSGLPWEAIFTGIKVAIQAVVGVLKNVASFVEAAFRNDLVRSFAVGIGLAVLALKGFSIVTGIASSIKGMFTVFKAAKAVAGNVKLLQFALTNMAGESKIAAAAAKVLNLVMSANPWVILAAAIAAVVAGLVWFFTQTTTGRQIWAGFVSWLQGVWQGLVGIAQGVWTAITQLFSAAVETVQNAWTGIGSFFSGLWSSITAGVSSAVTGIQSAWAAVASFFTTLWTGITTAATTAWNAVVQGIMAIVGPFIPIFQNLWTGLTTALSTIWNGIVSVAEGVWNLVKNVILAPVLVVIDLLTGNWSQLGSDLEGIWNNIVSAAQSIWNGIVQVFSGVWDAIKAYATAVWQAIGTALSAIWSSLVSGAKSIWSSLTSFFSGLWNGIKSTAASVWNGIVSFLTGLWNGLKSTAQSIWNGLGAAIKSVISGLQGWLSSTWNAIKSTVISVANGIKQGAINAWNGMVSGVKGIINSVKGVFNSLRNIDLFAIGKNIVQGLINGISNMVGAVGRAIGKVADTVTGGIRKVLGIHSPSKVLTQLGIYTGQGFANGISNMVGTVSKVAAQLADAAVVDVPTFDLGGFGNMHFSTAEQLMGGSLATAPNSQTINNYTTTNQTQQVMEQVASRPITVVSQIDGTEVARATVKPMDEQLGRRWDDQSRKMNK